MKITTEYSVTTISNEDRSADISHDLSVIFCHAIGGGEFSVSRRKSSRSYKTEASAMRAAKRWVSLGK